MKIAKFLAGVLFFAIFFAALLISFAQDEPMVQVTVEKGDCLIRVCNKYLEKPAQWRTIAQINKIKNPDVILPGQTLLIPASLMKGTPVSGTVTFLKGTAEFKPRDKEEWIPLILGDEVGEGVMIRTGAESSVEIKFKDGNTFLLQPNTTIGLQTARKSGDKYSEYKMSLKLGKLISNVEKSSGRIQIETPTAVAGVRGTTFQSSVVSDGSSKFEVFEGSVTVTGENEAVEVKEGEGSIVQKGKAPTPPKKLLQSPVLATGVYQPVYTKFPVRLSFDTVEGAVSYRVVLAKDKDAKDILKEETIGPQDIFEIAEMEDGTYFMRSSSIDELGLEGSPSKAVAIQIRLNPVTPFVEIPRDRAEYQGTSLTCKWLKVAGASRYRIQIIEHIPISPDKENWLIVQDRSDITETEYVAGNLGFNKHYYFRVRAIAPDNYQGEWSDLLRFTLKLPSETPAAEPQ